MGVFSCCLEFEANMSSGTEKVAAPKAPKVAKAKKPAAKSSPSRPATSVMVESAIGSLKERKGSSLIAIKKYIATNYKVDPVKHSHFIKKALASGVEKKSLIQVKGVGASGSFKLAKVEAKPKKKPASSKPKPSAKKSTSKKKAKKATPKKAKKPAAKKPAPKKAKKPTPKKAKKAAPKKKAVPKKK